MSEVRPISVIEQRVMRRVVDKIAGEISKNWAQVTKFNTSVKRFESNPEFVQIVPSSEPVVVVSMEIKIHGNSSLMNICYPYMWISNIVSMPEVQERILFGAKESSPEEKSVIEYNIRNTSMPLRTLIGRTNISIKDFLELRKGDVISLDSRTDRPLEVYVSNKHLFNAVVGIKNKRYAIRIVSDVQGENEDEF